MRSGFSRRDGVVLLRQLLLLGAGRGSSLFGGDLKDLMNILLGIWYHSREQMLPTTQMHPYHLHLSAKFTVLWQSGQKLSPGRPQCVPM